MKLFLPPLSDKSITTSKLRKLLVGSTTSLPLEIVEPFEHKLKVASQRLKNAILALYGENETRIWFEEGPLPSNAYLAQFLYSMDCSHPLLGKFVKQRVQRKLKVNEKCGPCVRRNDKKLAKQAKRQQPAGHRPFLGPDGIPVGTLPYNQVVKALRSRHKILGLRGGMKQDALVARGFTAPEKLAAMQSEIFVIDKLIDRLIAIQM